MYLPGVSPQSICSGRPKRHCAAEASLECSSITHGKPTCRSFGQQPAVYVYCLQQARRPYVCKPMSTFSYVFQEIRSSEATSQLLQPWMSLTIGYIGRTAHLLGISRNSLAGCGLDGTAPCKVRKFGCKQVLVKPCGTRFCGLSMTFLAHAQTGTSSEPATKQLVEAACPSRRQDKAGIG